MHASPVFERMCGSSFKESNSDIVTFPIREVSHAVAHTFVAFLYTALLPLHADWIALIQLGDMYDVQVLIEACMEKLAETSTANIIWTVDQFLRHSMDSPVGEFCKRFIEIIVTTRSRNRHRFDVLDAYLCESDNQALMAIARRAYISSSAVEDG